MKNKHRTPVLAQLNAPREKWKDSAPRLTEDQKRILQDITRLAYSKIKKEINRNNFGEVHERLENELAEKILERFGLMSGVEWKGVFTKEAALAFKGSGMDNPGYVEGLTPTPDFLESELFDYIEVFQPRIVLFQFEEYDRFMRYAEESIQQSEKRRKDGDAYFTDRDKQISYHPEVLPGDEVRE